MARFYMLLTLTLLYCLAPPNLSACNYSAMMRSFNRAVEKYLDDPTPARADRICRIIARINNKFGKTRVVPPPPDGVMCAAMPELGNGRGGGPGAVIIGIGQGGEVGGWVRNPTDQPCTYEWEIIPDPLNPAGFTVFPLSGSVVVPPFSSAAATFDIALGPGILPDTVAFFDIFWFDTCSGLPLGDDSARFRVFADPEITLLPQDPFILAVPQVPLPVFFEITNHTDAPVTRTFDFVHIGDPASEMALNNGMPFDAINLFPDDKSVSSVEVTVDPFSTDLFLKETLMLGEICDPEMINCCGLQFGDAVCCSMILNDDLAPRRVTPLFQDLIGDPTGVGFIGFQIDGITVQIPTDFSPNPPDLLDMLTVQTIQQSLFTDGFNFSPLVDDTGFMLMTPLLPTDFFSTDPGLLWLPSPPPLQDYLPLWPEPGLELHLQSMVMLVNGERPVTANPRGD